MAASRGRSSKTAHVLSLLSGASASEPQAADQTAAPPQTTDAPAPSDPPAAPMIPPPSESRHLSPPILEVARSNNAALSESIRGALQAALEEELADDEASPSSASKETPPLSPEESVQQSPPSEESTVSIPPEPEQAAPPRTLQEESAPLHQEERSAPTPPPAPEPEPPAQNELEPINVMELLVEEKLARYVGLFGLCTCPRCLADTKALALTRLPAKYVVLSPEERMARLSFYQSKYDGDVTTQILYACKAVLDAPRHGSEETPSPSK